jgi:hypothetical protein
MTSTLNIIKSVLKESENDSELKKAKFGNRGTGPNGESEPTKNQPSFEAHVDAAKYHDGEALTYTKALRHQMSDPKNRIWYLKAIARHRAAAKEHRNLAKKTGRSIITTF